MSSASNPLQFHFLEKLRGRAVSFSHVAPHTRMCIREMNRALATCEAHLEPEIELDEELRVELGQWLRLHHLLNKDRKFEDFHEVDIIMANPTH